MMTTPDGKAVAMVHCNTCTSDLDAWVKIFAQVLEASGVTVNKGKLYDMVYYKALEGDADCGGLVAYNCYGGEPVAELDEGRPLFTRTLDAKFSLPNFARSLIYGTFATLQLGMNILQDKEKVKLDSLLGHGGLFKTKGVAQNLLASALGVPVSVMESAGEGGPWGMALLAAYRGWHHAGNAGELPDFLDKQVFAGVKGSKVEPDAKDAVGFASYIKRYKAALPAEREAGKALV
jgi:sugar (pentulose or hexulose) kinase